MGKQRIFFEITIEDARQLAKIMRAIEMVSGVTKVERVKHMKTSIDLSEDNKR